MLDVRFARHSGFVRAAVVGTALFSITLLGFPPPTSALVSFGRPAPLSPTAATDDGTGEFNDSTPWAAGDGDGNWIALWRSLDTLGGTIGSDGNVLLVRSIDGAATWSSPVAIDPENLSVGSGAARIETDHNGVWVAAWARDSGQIVASRSLDVGLVWSAPVVLGPGVRGVRLATDGAGTWVTMWWSKDDLGGTIGTDEDLLASTSTDDGATWSTPIAVNTDAAVDGSTLDVEHTIATDAGGRWLALWRRRFPSTVVAAQSVDAGLSWTVPVVIDTTEDTDDTTMAMDTAGRAIAVWESDDSFGGTLNTNAKLVFSVSADAGSTWSAPAPLEPALAVDPESVDSQAAIATDGLGRWYVVWHTQGGTLSTVGADNDILVARSVNDGATWTRAAAVTSHAERDSGRDYEPSIAYDGAGGWVTAWRSADSFSGTLGEDFDPIVVSATDDCPVAPSSGCLSPVEPERSKIDLRDPPGARDLLSWAWARGAETLPSDLGDPTTTTDYVLCLYDDTGGAPGLVLETDAAGAAVCHRGKPCWKQTSKGFVYKDSRRLNSAIKKLGLRPGSAGKAKIKLKARGSTLGPPDLPLAKDPTVTIQLLNLENGRCWEALYSTPDTSDADRFRARSD